MQTLILGVSKSDVNRHVKSNEVMLDFPGKMVPISPSSCYLFCFFWQKYFFEFSEKSRNVFSMKLIVKNLGNFFNKIDSKKIKKCSVLNSLKKIWKFLTVNFIAKISKLFDSQFYCKNFQNFWQSISLIENFLQSNLLKKISKLFYSHFHWKTFRDFFGKFQKLFFTKKKKVTGSGKIGTIFLGKLALTFV